MIAEIRRVALFLVLGFVAVTGAVAYWIIIRAPDLENRPTNPRVIEQAGRTARGSFFAADGTVLAASVPVGGGFYRREYLLPSLAQTIGYVSVTFGLGGLEAELNDFLLGSRGADAWEMIRADLTRAPLHGADVHLTIDPRLQRAAAEALGERAGAVVALDPRTGAVRALVSHPDFDPNRIDAIGAALLKDATTPLINRATQGQYAPGSTFKTVTAAAALDGNVYRADATFRCPSGYVVEGFVIACAGVPAGVTQFDFAHAYAWSINATFAEVAVRAGAPTLVQTARRFGFEERIPFDLPVTPSRLLRGSPSFNNVLLANTGFGQGELSVSPLQMALVAATVANGGVLMEPYLVERITAEEGHTLRQHAPKSHRQVVSSDTAAALRAFMATAVRDGVSGVTPIPGLTVGGKTGTAEVTDGKATHAWFIGIAPVDQPQLAVAVIVENAGQGAAVAAPVARAVFAALPPATP